MLPMIINVINISLNRKLVRNFKLVIGRRARDLASDLNNKGTKKGLIAGGREKEGKKEYPPRGSCHLARYSLARRNKVVGDL